MSDPMKIPEGPQEQAPEEQPRGMRFFIKLDDLPSAPTYMQPLSLFRFEARDDRLITERFDKEDRKWVHAPGLIAFTGIGGDESFEEIDEESANQLIDQWAPDETETK